MKQLLLSLTLLFTSFASMAEMNLNMTDRKIEYNRTSKLFRYSDTGEFVTGKVFYKGVEHVTNLFSEPLYNVGKVIAELGGTDHYVPIWMEYSQCLMDVQDGNYHGDVICLTAGEITFHSRFHAGKPAGSFTLHVVAGDVQVTFVVEHLKGRTHGNMSIYQLNNRDRIKVIKFHQGSRLLD